MINANLPTSVINKLSPAAREFVINTEARLRQLDEDIEQCNEFERRLDSREGLL